MSAIDKIRERPPLHSLMASFGGIDPDLPRAILELDERLKRIEGIKATGFPRDVRQQQLPPKA